MPCILLLTELFHCGKVSEWNHAAILQQSQGRSWEDSWSGVEKPIMPSLRGFQKKGLVCLQILHFCCQLLYCQPLSYPYSRAWVNVLVWMDWMNEAFVRDRQVKVWMDRTKANLLCEEKHECKLKQWSARLWIDKSESGQVRAQSWGPKELELANLDFSFLLREKCPRRPEGSSAPDLSRPSILEG